MSGSSFNSGNGFSPRRPDFNGYSLLSTSPFRSDGEAVLTGAKDITPDSANPSMGWVLSRPDRNGKQRRSWVRIACEHWADKHASDCRYGCDAKAQIGAFTP